MKIESTAFTAADIATFMQELLEHERLILAERLERASDQLARLQRGWPSWTRQS